MIVAIDGPAGSGKSTTAKLAAERLGFRYLDTGAMYRAIAVRALAERLDLDDEAGVTSLAQRERVLFAHEEGSALPTRVTIGAHDVTAAIRTPEADAAVSHVARLARVREAMLAQQRSIAEGRDVVVEGRDIGTVVFPQAEVKVYLTASPHERARRRTAEQAERGHAVEHEEVLESIERRDEIDSTREVAPLQAAEDAVELDSTELSVDEVVDAIEALVHSARSAAGGPR
ncbi:MAG: (d)CMP kinase [Coriobacteriales bacterium]|nr:(d)CMP kinase [Coriobacteriales bacterium]